MLSDIYKAVSTLKSLRDLGVQVAIDDSGTDFPSLNYLRQLHIAMAHCLGLLAVAEGMKSRTKITWRPVPRFSTGVFVLQTRTLEPPCSGAGILTR